ncbi:MAG: c-type cytochrome [Alphaproteobacteria bacterium]
MNRQSAYSPLVLAAAAALALTAGKGALAEQDLEHGKSVYRDANCIGCHKWHGGGGGGYGGAALSLRETELDRDLLIEVISCGRPSTRMPYHSRGAYKTVDCYGGTTEADLGQDMPPKAAKLLRDEQIQAVADYVLGKLQGHGEVTYEDCIEFWGEGSKQCASMKK